MHIRQLKAMLFMGVVVGAVLLAGLLLMVSIFVPITIKNMHPVIPLMVLIMAFTFYKMALAAMSEFPVPAPETDDSDSSQAEA